MFDFKVMNRALNDSNLSDKAFRMLYTITNYCSLNNSNSVEVHNAHLMMVLDISERWVQKLTNELVEKGYITKVINGTSKNKLANTYTLIEVEVNDTPTDSLCDDINEGNKSDTQKFAQKFTLKNNNKINNKLIDPLEEYTTGGPIENNIDSLTDIPEVDNSNIESVNLEIEIRNRENEMNEERMNEMNDLKETIEKDNNITPTLENVLREQAEEQNNLLREAYNDNFNFEECSLEESVKTVNNNFNREEQERYTRLFTNTKNLIDNWYKTHDAIVKANIETNIKIIGMMYQRGYISVKQFNTAQEKLTNHFNKLLKGHLEFVRNKKYSSTIFSNKNPQPPRPEENENKAVLSHENDSAIQTIIEDNKTQQEANKAAKMAIVERECNARRKQFSLDTMEMLVNTLNSFVESNEERKEWINRYFDGMQHRFPSYLDIMKDRALNKI